MDGGEGSLDDKRRGDRDTAEETQVSVFIREGVHFESDFDLFYCSF